MKNPTINFKKFKREIFLVVKRYVVRAFVRDGVKCSKICGKICVKKCGQI